MSGEGDGPMPCGATGSQEQYLWRGDYDSLGIRSPAVAVCAEVLLLKRSPSTWTQWASSKDDAHCFWKLDLRARANQIFAMSTPYFRASSFRAACAMILCGASFSASAQSPPV